eukprot:8532940-Alexandrium_andersonii.AAC.1
MPLHLRVWTDSSSARALAVREGPGRMRHIDVTRMWIQEILLAKRATLHKIDTRLNTADIGTKYLKKDDFQRHARNLGLVDLGDDPEKALERMHHEEEVQKGGEHVVAAVKAKCPWKPALLAGTM